MHPLAAHLLRIVGVSLGAFLAVVGIPALVLALLVAGVDDPCGNLHLLEVPSSSGDWKAVVFERDCGATTGFSTQVSVIKAGASLSNEGGNVFVADTNHNAAPSGQGGGPVVRVTWIAHSRIRIEHHPLVRPIKAQPSYNGIRVDYVPTPSAG